MKNSIYGASNSMKKVAIYARVSTQDQTTDNQLNQLREVAARNGWIIVREFIDHGISGAKSAADRPALANLLKAVTRREFDVVVAWDVSRLGRSLQDLIGFLNDISAKHVDLYLHQQGLDTSTPTGRMIFQMCGVFAEFERGMIRDRVLAGLERAKRQGKRLGRPTNCNDGTRSAVIHLRTSLNWGIQKIASELKIGTGSVYRILGDAA
jgi:DNA invertase Pin-like site-specific DNA recombinase